ncbi:MAG: hypothetical protein HY543_10090 [Deltaproteobacteria bacterium]|nr:hypothetical protein [Deltaproteobacteria bacterium]
MLTFLSPLEEECKTLRAYCEVDATVYLRPSCIWQGRLGPHGIVLARTGIGKAAMRAAATFCIERLGATELVLLGFGGATAPGIHPGDLVIAASVIDGVAGHALGANGVAARAADALRVAHDAHLAAQTGVVVTMPHLIPSSHEKAFLGTKYQADAVDMEGIALAEAAEARGLPWLVVRAIIDTMELPLPAPLAAVHADGTTAYGAVLRHCLREPQVLAHLPRLHAAAVRARERLTGFAKAWIAK